MRKFRAKKKFDKKYFSRTASKVKITTVVTTDSIGKACNSMKYTAERLNGEITKIERDELVEDQEHSSDK